jgi:inhibitor of cysteine peptidase
MIQLDDSASGQDVSVQVGERFRLTLAETPTTGYRWTLVESGEPILEVVEDRFEPAGGVGGGGAHLWLLRAGRPGRAVLELHRVRPWEPDATPVEVFTLSVTAR